MIPTLFRLRRRKFPLPMDTRKFSFLMLALFVLLTQELNAQLKTTLNLEAGTMWNMLKVDDPGHLFQKANVHSS